MCGIRRSRVNAIGFVKVGGVAHTWFYATSESTPNNPSIRRCVIKLLHGHISEPNHRLLYTNAVRFAMREVKRTRT